MTLIWPLAIISTIGSVALPQDTLPVTLLREMTQEPRIVGTAGYERAMDLIEARLERANILISRTTVSRVRAIPTHSDVLLFEDSVATSAFAGLRERWSPDATPTAPLPAAYAFNPEAADVRGPIVNLGAGTANDIKRLADLNVPLAGAVGLLLPAHGVEDLGKQVERAADAGLAGLLVASVPGTPNDQISLLRSHTSEALEIPCVPIRGIEVAQILGRLRAKRVRGKNGQAETLKLGPGPVAAQLTIVCPWETIRGVRVIRVDGTGDAPIFVDTDEVPSRPAGGAPIVAAALAAQLTAADGARSLMFGPSGNLHRGARSLAAVLAPTGTLAAALNKTPEGPLTAWGKRSQIHGVLNESASQLDRNLSGSLSKRMDAAVDWIAYLLSHSDQTAAMPPRSASVLTAPFRRANK